MSDLLVLGGTGAVGRAVLRQALADSGITRVIAPTRRPLDPDPGLENPVVDFDSLDGTETFWKVGAVICAIGTTQKLAGGREGFRCIDRDLVLRLAGFARASGVANFAYVSSVGASLASPSFYLRTKGEVETGLGALGFRSLTILRPSMIDAGRREVARPGEEIGASVMRLAGPLLPRRYRPVTPDAIARRLLAAALDGPPGVSVIQSEEIV
ncbi:MAG: NAD(P)H-binding protein [Zavarzinia sp.]|nr:NAD(P)H-binding protein [Zavarzinia sp.]